MNVRIPWNEELKVVRSHQTPPAASFLSKTVTWSPAARRWPALTTPLIPAPITATRLIVPSAMIVPKSRGREERYLDLIFILLRLHLHSCHPHPSFKVARLKCCCPKWSVYGLRFRHSGYEAKHWSESNQNGLKSIYRISRHHLKRIINCQHMIIVIFVADEEMETFPTRHTAHSGHRLALGQVIRNEQLCYWIQMRGKRPKVPVIQS